MIFTYTLYISLIIFCITFVYKISTWFTRSIGIVPEDVTALKRVRAASRGIFRTIAGKDVLSLLRIFILEVVVQRKTFREDFYRWTMHICILYGFMFLVVMHAMGSIITVRLFPEYYSTINPFLFLRDVAGIMVFAGVGMAIYRRIALKKRRLVTNKMDLYAIAIISVIMLSGFALESTKIVSPSAFNQMVEEYAELDDEEDIHALKAYWMREFGSVSGDIDSPVDEKLVEKGKKFHEETCANCHSSIQWAFGGYAFSSLIKPSAMFLERINARNILWYIHFLSCFIGLAYLPFSKMFHMIAGPVSIMSNGIMGNGKSDPLNILTRQVMELDACTHCGTCTIRCSAAAAYGIIDNPEILPSEKMLSLRELSISKKINEKQLAAISQGVYLCTNCDRCTVSCPVGINLRELWFNVREFIIMKGLAEPLVLSQFSYYRGLNRASIPSSDYSRPVDAALNAMSETCLSIKEPDRELELSGNKDSFIDNLTSLSDGRTFSYCFACENCSTICPVVTSYENPLEHLGLLPHQIMRSAGLGLRDLALGSKMLWNCLTCYQCQEHCPQGVRVTDVLYCLKNQAIRDYQHFVSK